MDVRKNSGRRRRPKIFGLFFGGQNQDFSGKFFFDLSGSAIFDISEFHGCKIWSIFKSGGCKLEKSEIPRCKIQRFFFGVYVEEG